MNKKLNIIFTSAFCAALVIPVVSLNYGKLTSDTENRTLAAFPSRSTCFCTSFAA